MDSKDTFNNNASGTENHLLPQLHQRRSAIVLREEDIGDPERDPILIGLARLEFLENRIKEFLRHEMREDEIYEKYNSPEEFEEGVNRIFQILISNCEETLNNGPNDNQSPNNDDDGSIPPSPTISIDSTRTDDPGKSFFPENNFGLEWSTPSLKKFDYIPRKVRHKNKEFSNDDKIIIPSPFPSEHGGINSSAASLNVNISDSEASSLTSIDSVATPQGQPISPTFSQMFAKSKHKNKVKMKSLRNFGASAATGNSNTRKISAGKKPKTLVKKQILRPWPKQKTTKSKQKESTLSKNSILKLKNVDSNIQLVCSPIGSRPQSPINDNNETEYINIIPEDYFVDLDFSPKEDPASKENVDDTTQVIKPLNNDSKELIYLHVGNGLPAEKETVVHSSYKSTNLQNDLKTQFRKKVRITFDVDDDDDEPKLANYRSKEDDLNDQTSFNVVATIPIKSEGQDYQEDIYEENSMNNNNSNRDLSTISNEVFSENFTDPAVGTSNSNKTACFEQDTSYGYKVYDYMIKDNLEKDHLKSTIESVLKKVKEICPKTSLLKCKSPTSLKQELDENFNQDNKEDTQNIRLDIENGSLTNSNGNASHELKDFVELTQTFERSTITGENKSDTSADLIERPTSSNLSISPNDFGLEERILMLQVENILDTTHPTQVKSSSQGKADVAISTSDLLPKYCRPQYLQHGENLIKFLPRIPSSNSGMGLSIQASEIFRRYEFMHSSSTEAAGAEANSKNIWLSPFTKYSKKKSSSKKFKDIQNKKKSSGTENVKHHNSKSKKDQQQILTEISKEQEKISFIVGPSPVEQKRDPFIPKNVKKLKPSRQKVLSSETKVPPVNNQSKEIINVKRTVAESKLPVPIMSKESSRKIQKDFLKENQNHK